MKYKGKSLAIHEYTVLTLPRKNCEPLTLKVNALPIGLGHDFQSMCPRPRPPFTMTVSKGGGQQRLDNYDDPAYLEASRDYRDLERYYVIFLALRGNEDLAFDNTPVDLNSLRLFRDEIKAAGFSEGDAKKILDAAVSAAGINDTEVSDARKSF